MCTVISRNLVANNTVAGWLRRKNAASSPPLRRCSAASSAAGCVGGAAATPPARGQPFSPCSCLYGKFPVTALFQLPERVSCTINTRAVGASRRRTRPPRRFLRVARARHDELARGRRPLGARVPSSPSIHAELQLLVSTSSLPHCLHAHILQRALVCSSLAFLSKRHRTTTSALTRLLPLAILASTLLLPPGRQSERVD